MTAERTKGCTDVPPNSLSGAAAAPVQAKSVAPEPASLGQGCYFIKKENNIHK